MAQITMGFAVRDAIAEEMRRDKRVFVMGEDVRTGFMGITAHIVDEFGPERVRNTPISENTIVESALGAASAGMRPVVDIMFAAFLYVAANPTITDVARAKFMFGNQGPIPMVIFGLNGAANASGASHSDSVQAKLMNAPGLKIVVPSNPYDAKGLMKTAIRDDSPVIFLAHMAQVGEMGEVPDEEYTIPFGQAAIKREGKDVTVIATCNLVQKALNVAESLASRGISVEVIDPRTLCPLDKGTILKSVAKTGRLVAMDESNETCGVCSEISATVCEEAFDSLKAPIKRVATMMIPFGGSLLQESYILPDEQKLTKAIEEILG